MRELEPLNDRLICKRTHEERMSKGGLVIPQTAKERNLRATVVAIGPDVGSTTIKVGDELLVNKWVFESIEIDGENFGVVKEGDVSARVIA